jgi:fumarylpyruvate hydrolase
MKQTIQYAFELPKIPSLPVRGREVRFPVHRIYCVGRNYAAHSIEMGGDPNREPPFFFQKNPDNIVADSGSFPYPDKSGDVHHEIELVIGLGRGGRNVPVTEAAGCIFGYAVGLDMTRRDLQNECKDKRQPWEIAKAFEHSAPVSEVVPAEECPSPDAGAIWLNVNGQVRQQGDLSQLIWKVPEIVSYLSGLFQLTAGDLIMSGTPAGVAAVKRGDVLHGHVDGIGDLHTRVI